MRVAREEIFGPGPVGRAGAAIWIRPLKSAGASLLTATGAFLDLHPEAAGPPREFKQRFNAGMIGVNVGVPAPMAWFPFTGWNQSFFGDLHIQGIEGDPTSTRRLKMTMTRWFASASDPHHDPVWRRG